jgi:hypothetical protein
MYIFNKVLHHFINPGKLVEANDGYVRHADKLKCPKKVANLAENQTMQSRVRVYHKMLNRWLKNWGILSQTFTTTSLCKAMSSRHAG